MVATILVFKYFIADVSVIAKIFQFAGYTYGPLLGLYAFGLFTKKQIKDKWVWIIAIASPIVAFLLNMYSKELFFGYQFGFEILIVNGLLVFLGLLLISKKRTEEIGQQPKKKPKEKPNPLRGGAGGGHSSTHSEESVQAQYSRTKPRKRHRTRF